jgi:hypothetical protein
MDKRFKHGLTKTKEHNIWCKMRSRCNKVYDQCYFRYGGRGIKVCERWDKSFNNFFEDMGPSGEGFSIDRSDNEKGYSPDNCRWATKSEQAYNRRNANMVTYKGEEKNLKKWCVELGIDFRGTWQRLKRGWTVEEAFEKALLPRHPYAFEKKPNHKNAA